MKSIKDMRLSGKLFLLFLLALITVLIILSPYTALFLASAALAGILCTALMLRFFVGKASFKAMADKLTQLMKKSKNVYIICHKRPDFDSIGAAVGLCAMAETVGRQCRIVVDKQSKAFLRLCRDFENTDEELFVSSKEAYEAVSADTLLIVSDACSTKMLDSYSVDMLEKVKKTAIVDHHAAENNIVRENGFSFSDASASSTSELVTMLAESKNTALTAEEAGALLAGIIIDTNHFSINTGKRTMHCAQYLLEKGADMNKVDICLKPDEELVKLKAGIVETAWHLKPDILVSQCDIQCRDIYVAAAQAANELLNSDGIEAAFVFYIVNDRVFVSGRSSGKIDMNGLLSKIGGGGHAAMAGAEFKTMNMDEAKAAVAKLINENYREEKPI